MQERKWRELGEVLRRFRKSMGFSQDQAISRSGGRMSPRTLRAYEAGEQRPSRERLLGLLLNSFGQKSTAEINQCLQTAGYAALTDLEASEFGLRTASLRPVPVAPVSVGPPVDYRIETSTVIATDGEGRELWRHRFPDRLTKGAYEGEWALRRCAFADVDADGGVETLFVYFPVDFASVGTELFCFGQDGRVKWKFIPGKPIKDTRQEYLPPYFISNVKVVPIGNDVRILVSSNHYLHNPNQVAVLDAAGQLVSDYWHSGHLYVAAHVDLNNDGIDEILLAGVNNGYRLGTLLVFDPRNVSGASTQPGRQILGFPPGTEKAVVLFPRTCVSQNASYIRTLELRITRERRIVVAVCDGISEQRNPGVMIYELDFKLNILNCRPDSHLQEAHRELELEGKLDHSWTEEENERLRSQVIVKGLI